MKDKNVMTEKILDLTLEIIYLLTGEDHMVVKKPGGNVSHVSSHCVSDITRHTQSLGMEPPPRSLIHERHNEQKILELTHQIIRLLTEEGWQHGKGHKVPDDVFVKDRRPPRSPGFSKTKTSSALETQATPVSSSQGNAVSEYNAEAEFTRNSVRRVFQRAAPREDHLTDVDDCKSVKRTQTPCTVRCVKEETTLCDRGDLLDIEVCPPTDIKEEPASCRREDLSDTDVYPQTGYPSLIKEEPASSDGGDLSDTDVYPETAYPSFIKEEPASSDEGDLSDTDVYPPAEQSETEHLTTVIKEEPDSGEEENSFNARGIRKNLAIMKDKNVMTEKILDLTLEIIYLLTGEDHMVVKKPGGNVSHVSSHCVSDITRHTQSLGMEPPPRSLIHERHNEQKILELTHQIIRLLTEEGWQHGKGHKVPDDVFVKDRRPPRSPGFSKTKTSSALETQATPVSSSQGNAVSEYNAEAEFTRNSVRRVFQRAAPREDHLTDVDDCKSVKRTQTPCTVRCVKEETTLCDRGDLLDIEVCPPTDIKEEPASCRREDLSDTDVYPQTGYPSLIKEEPASSDGGDLSDTDVYPETAYPSFIKEEPASSDEGDLSDTDVYPPAEQSETEHLTTVIKEEPDSGEEENSFNAVIYFPQQMPFEDTASGDESVPASHFSSTEGSSAFPDLGNRTYFQNPEILNYQPGNAEKKRFPCSECEKSFTHKSILLRHQQIHSGSKPYPCPECGKGFRQKSDLEKHRRVHTGAKPYSCSACGKSFSQKTHLDLHQTVHTGEKSYACTECGKCFSHKSYLVSHFRIHTGSKPYCCTVCGKCFSHRAYLSSHNRTHTGFKPHSCAECGKCFSRKSILVTHQRTHTREKPYPCWECGKSYAQKPHLHLHQKNAH